MRKSMARQQSMGSTGSSVPTWLRMLSMKSSTSAAEGGDAWAEGGEEEGVEPERSRPASQPEYKALASLKRLFFGESSSFTAKVQPHDDSPAEPPLPQALAAADDDGVVPSAAALRGVIGGVRTIPNASDSAAIVGAGGGARAMVSNSDGALVGGSPLKLKRGMGSAGGDDATDEQLASRMTTMARGPSMKLPPIPTRSQPQTTAWGVGVEEAPPQGQVGDEAAKPQEEGVGSTSTAQLSAEGDEDEDEGPSLRSKPSLVGGAERVGLWPSLGLGPGGGGSAPAGQARAEEGPLTAAPMAGNSGTAVAEGFESVHTNPAFGQPRGRGRGQV